MHIPDHIHTRVRETAHEVFRNHPLCKRTFDDLCFYAQWMYDTLGYPGVHVFWVYEPGELQLQIHLPAPVDKVEIVGTVDG